MKLLVAQFNINKKRFCLNIISILLGLIAFILYLSTGVIRGFTDTLSAWVPLFIVLSIILGILTLFKNIGGLNSLPLAGYIIALLLFLTHNSNYIVAVMRGIDLTSFSGGFITTIILLLLACITNLVAVCFKNK